MEGRNSENGHLDTEVPLKNMARAEEGSIPQETDNENEVALNNRRVKKKIFTTRRCIKYLGLVVFLIFAGLLFTYLVMHYLEETDYTRKSTSLIPPNPDVEPPPSGSILHVFQNGAVCSDADVCSKIGRDILNRGGNIMDSALATLFCNGIATMQSMGLGGGFLMNVFIKNENKAYTLDAREVAPIVATEDMFHDKPKDASMHGPLSIAVPGEVMGYWEAHKRFGSMTWKEIIEPSIKVCEDGVILSKHMHDALIMNRKIKTDPHLCATFVNKTTNEFHRIGSVIHPPKELCETYRQLAANGGQDFYNGTIARKIADDLKDIKALVTAKDLANYKVEWRDSIPVDLNGDIMYVVPPTGSGTILALMLTTLRGYNFTKDDLSTVNSTILTYHRTLEAFKFAFGKRSLLGDIKFNNLTSVIEELTSLEYGDLIRKQINDEKSFNSIKHYGGKFWLQSDNGTSHLSILAPNGDAIAVTSTINFYFGSVHSGKRTGIIFNSGMDDFSSPGVLQNFFGLPSSKPNFIQPGKRAMSSMCPTIVTDVLGNVKLVIGSAGGSKIPTAVAMVIMRVLWFGQDIKEAIDAPRIHHQLVPNELEYEFGVLQDVIAGLEAKGHRTLRYRKRGSTMCGITKNKTAIYANADYRKKGDAYGL